MLQQPNIYVLSLSDGETRRSALIQQLEEMGLKYIIWNAIDGRQGLPEQYNSLIDRERARQRMGRNMSDTEFACALSHRAMQQDILDRKLSGALILEDDAILTEDFQGILSLLPLKGQDLTLLYHKGGYAWRRAGAISQKHNIHRIALHPNGAVAYYITQAAAARVINANTPVQYVADWPLDLSRISACILQPRPVEVTLANSAIEGSRLDKKKSRSNRSMRFLQWSYWRRKYLKLASEKLC